MSQLPVKKEVSVKLEPNDGVYSLDAESSSGKGSSSVANPNSNGAGKAVNNSKDKGWQDIALKCCSQKELDDVRYHILKFHTKQDVDIVKSFTKPVRMHRKDPRNIQFQLTREEIDRRKREQELRKQNREEGGNTVELPTEGDEGMGEEGTDDDIRRHRGQMDMSQVAPDGGARKTKKHIFKRKTKQINLMDEAKRKLRYEEYYPWVLEDYNGKNVYVGNYEAGSSDTQHVLFVFDKDGFKMVPAEKVYKFTPRNKYATLTLEEAEAKMEKNASAPRWLMKHMQEGSTGEGAAPDMRYRHVNGNGSAPVAPASSRSRKLKTVMGGSNSNERDSDHDDIDFDEEFADDEEAPIMDGDEEENKLSEKKIKREMLKASHFDGQSDADVDDDDDINDLFETEKSRKVDKEGKKLRKVLNKTEGGVYDSDDNDENNVPYVSQSDLESGNESEDEEITVKKEDTDELSKPDANAVKVRSFIASNLGDGFVLIKAPVLFLEGFPKGQWNPNSHKRQISQVDVSPKKKIKIEPGTAPLVKLEKERSSISPSPSPITPGSPERASNMDLNSTGVNNELVSVNEVLGIVKNNPLTTKELLTHLRNRISAHKDNKQRIISIVKQTLKLMDGKLVLKEDN